MQDPSSADDLKAWRAMGDQTIADDDEPVLSHATKLIIAACLSAPPSRRGSCHLRETSGPDATRHGDPHGRRRFHADKLSRTSACPRGTVWSTMGRCRRVCCGRCQCAIGWLATPIGSLLARAWEH